MTESPYAIPVEDLVNSARVPVTAQVEEQPERRFLGGDASGDAVPWGDGTSAEADGE
jgi:hypothetical protein